MHDRMEKREELYEEHLNSHTDVPQHTLDVFGADLHIVLELVYDTRNVPIPGQDLKNQSRMQRVVRSQNLAEVNR